MKKCGQPRDSARKPVLAEIRTLGIAMRLVKRANWVAVNLTSQSLAIKAVKAADPMPAVAFSKMMVKVSSS